MSRKIYMILSILLIVSFALTACGAPATEAPPPATDATAVTEAHGSGYAASSCAARGQSCVGACGRQTSRRARGI